MKESLNSEYPMKNNTIATWLLTLSAVLMLIACIVVERPVQAQEVSSNRDYTVATHPGQSGDAVYIIDHNRGLVGVFLWDSTTRSLQARAVRPINDAFQVR